MKQRRRVCKLPDEKFRLPRGYTFGRCYSPKTGRAYLGTVPSKKRVIRICEAISAMTERDQTLLDQEIVVAKLNRTMIGWANYFCLGPVSKAYNAVENQCACKRLRQWLCAKHKVMSGHQAVFAGLPYTSVLGLVRLTRRTSHVSRGRHREPFSESRKREIRPSGSMSGMWKRKHGEANLRHRRTKGPDTMIGRHLHHTAPHLDSTAKCILAKNQMSDYPTNQELSYYDAPYAITFLSQPFLL